MPSFTLATREGTSAIDSRRARYRLAALGTHGSELRIDRPEWHRRRATVTDRELDLIGIAIAIGKPDSFTETRDRSL